MIRADNTYTLLSIDAWRYDDGWTWNQWFKIEEDIYLEDITPRKLFAFMRRNGWLSDYSKGHVELDYDGYNYVVCDRSTQEPLFAFEPQYDV